MAKKIEKYSTVVNEIKKIISSGIQNAYASTNQIIILTYWNIGKRIVEQEQQGKKRAEYGTALIETLADELTKEFGKNYSKRNLQYYRKFYLYFPTFDTEIVNACVHFLSWSHIRCFLRVENPNARLWYLKEASEQNWSYRTLERNISTQYYERLLNSPKKEIATKEITKKTNESQKKVDEFIKNPIVAEFLGFKNEDTFLESKLETAILSHIRDFLMELGRGFAFVARQQHIMTQTQDFFIDLVFYNIELKCYVLIDLKIGKVTHQDVGQMDMYVRMYDDLKRINGENPTIGILLCSETDEDIARYSVLHDNDRLFMSKYLTYLPTKEQLKIEIEKQKMIYELQHKEKEEDNI